MPEGGWEKAGLTLRNEEKGENSALFESKIHKNKD